VHETFLEILFWKPIASPGVLSSPFVDGCATNETTLAMKTITVSRILAGCLFAPALVHAQSESRQPRGERPGERPVFQTMWEKHDADGDGFLSFEEFKAMPRIARLEEEQQTRLFQRLDKNQDGKISREELSQMRQGNQPGRPDRGMRRLMELDKDGSGGVSLEEFRAAEMFANLPPARVEALFRRLDADGNGQITPKDRPELPPMFRQGQGQGPRGERGGPWERGERGERGGPRAPGERPMPHRRMFNHLDPENSGTLNFDQFRKARGIASMDEDAQEALFLRLDTDGDRRLTFQEFSNLPPDMFAPPARREAGEERRRTTPGERNGTPKD